MIPNAADLGKISYAKTTPGIALFSSPVDAPLDAVVHHEEADLGAQLVRVVHLVAHVIHWIISRPRVR